MLFDQDFLDALEAVESQSWGGEAWRFVLGETDPFQPNTRGARWNPPDTAALYTSLEKTTVLAELDHVRHLQTPPLRRELFVLHTIRTQVTKMLDLSDRDLLARLGIDDSELSSDNQIACRRVGGAAAWLGHDGILVPSARADGMNLVVFVNTQHPDLPLELVSSEPLSATSE
jgi:RES domain-containing protein